MSESRPTKNRVLFVDDDPAFLQMVQRMMGLQSKGGWEILTAESASRAMGILQQGPVDLIVIDVQMPVVDGLQFLTLLNRRHPNLPKVVLTGFATEAYRVACLSNGAELFLEKPMTPADQQGLYSALNEVMKFQPAAEEGFQGVLRRVGLPDVIQMECLSTNSSVLEITGRNRSGRIYIRDGNIVHAESGSLQGEEAFQKLLCLRGGEFKLERYQEPAQQTIEAPWEFLVMEAARKRDELSGQPEREPEREVSAPDEPELPDGDATFQDEADFAAATSALGTVAAPPPAPAPAPKPPADVVPSAAATDEAAVAAAAAAAAAAGPARIIREFMVCGADGTVLHEWEVRNNDLWVNFIEFVSRKARGVAQTLPFGGFSRFEAAEGDERLITLVRQDRGVLVRCTEESD